LFNKLIISVFYTFCKLTGLLPADVFYLYFLFTWTIFNWWAFNDISVKVHLHSVNFRVGTLIERKIIDVWKLTAKTYWCCSVAIRHTDVAV
jgi:hypothetical protein